VVAREVTLLPRHWHWLNAQPGGASVTLRKLVEAARRASETDGINQRQTQERTHRIMTALAGNEPGYEEALRALYSINEAAFHEFTEPWPVDVRDHVRAMSIAVFLPDPGGK
jgi:hypothetical protein